MGSRIGVMKIAAGRCGMSFDDYMENINKGLKRCWQCKEWQAHSEFVKDVTRGDGLDPRCMKCRHYTNPKKMTGGPPSRTVAQASADAVRYAVKMGRLAAVDTLPCLDCGKPAQHYHHHLGYSKKHLLDVVALCAGCHRLRHFS